MPVGKILISYAPSPHRSEMRDAEILWGYYAIDDFEELLNMVGVGRL
jgi:hypothetical protein